MSTLIGVLVVWSAALAGFLFEHGAMPALHTSIGLWTTVIAAAGATLVANPPRLLLATLVAVARTFKQPKYSKAFYLDNIRMLAETFGEARKHGLMKLEADVDSPEKSVIFAKYPTFVKDGKACQFLCDTLRLAMSGGMSASDVDELMKVDIDAYTVDSDEPLRVLKELARIVPAMGIAAALLSASAVQALVPLVFSFLVSFGLIQPLAAKVKRYVNAEAIYLDFLRTAVATFLKGAAPLLAVECARRAIPHAIRPSFEELERACKAGAAQSAAA